MKIYLPALLENAQTEKPTTYKDFMRELDFLAEDARELAESSGGINT